MSTLFASAPLLFAHTSAVLAQAPGQPTGPEFGKASPFGLVIVVILLAGTVLLVRSMNKHIKRLPATFEPEHPEPDQAADDGTDPGVAEISELDAAAADADDASVSARRSAADVKGGERETGADSS